MFATEIWSDDSICSRSRIYFEVGWFDALFYFPVFLLVGTLKQYPLEQFFHFAFRARRVLSSYIHVGSSLAWFWRWSLEGCLSLRFGFHAHKAHLRVSSWRRVQPFSSGSFFLLHDIPFLWSRVRHLHVLCKFSFWSSVVFPALHLVPLCFVDVMVPKGQNIVVSVVSVAVGSSISVRKLASSTRRSWLW